MMAMSSQWPRLAGALEGWRRGACRLDRALISGTTGVAAGSQLMIAEAERRFPVRIRLAMPAGGLGVRLNQMQTWLDQNAGAAGWATTPSGIRTVVNDAIAIYLADATIASAFVARWCAGHRAEAADGLLRGREDEPTPRTVASH